MRPRRADVDLAIDARWIVPVEPAGALDRPRAARRRRHASSALVPGGGGATRLRAARARRRSPRTCCCPGLVNAHTHSAMTLLRGIADDVPLKAWLEQHIWPREGAVRLAGVRARRHAARLRPRCCAAASPAATTCTSIPDAAARAYEAAGMRAMLGLPVLDFPTPYAADADGYLQRRPRRARRVQARAAARVLARAARAVHGRRRDVREDRRRTRASSTCRSRRTCRKRARELDDALAATGATPLARLDRLGVTGPGVRRDPRGAPRAPATSSCSRASAATSCTARRRT